MLDFGKKFAKNLTPPCVIELVGDVGAGKTTFTRGLAAGLGIAEAVTSPSFTISKRYHFPLMSGDDGELVHYDFYRLPDPGIMQDEIAETIKLPHTIVIVEWAESVSNILPADKILIRIELEEDGSRTISFS